MAQGSNGPPKRGDPDSTARNIGAYEDEPTVAPRRATGARPAINVPERPAPAAPRQATGARPAINVPNKPAAPAGAPRQATGARPALNVPEQPKRVVSGSRPAIEPPPQQMSQETVIKMPNPMTSGGQPGQSESTVMFKSNLPSASDDDGEATAIGKGQGQSQSTVMFKPGEAAATAYTGEAQGQSQSTVMFKPGEMKPPAAPEPAKRLPGSARLLGNDQPEPAPTKRQPGDGALIDPNASPEEITEQKRHGIQILIGAVLVLVAVAFSARAFVGPSKPSDSELSMLYPYGESGGELPNGRRAPPVTEIVFEYQGAGDCGDLPCLKYKAARDVGGFDVEMDVRRENDHWVLVGGRGGLH